MKYAPLPALIEFGQPVSRRGYRARQGHLVPVGRELHEEPFWIGEEPALWLQLAACSSTAECVALANRTGPLQAEPPVLPGGVRGRRLRREFAEELEERWREPLQFWRSEARVLALVRALVEGLQGGRGARAKLEGLVQVRPHERGPYAATVQVLDTSAPPAVTARSIRLVEPVGSVHEGAQLVLASLANERLHEHVRLTVRRGDGKGLHQLVQARTLLGAIWLQVASAIERGIEVRRCPQCGGFMVADPTGPGRTAVYCSDRCRKAAHRARHRGR